ncbi:hypothetical protein F5Y10DRAFT_126322 [Nemania abortiva]|nr:hypothetical protein F5Y10DRAFT_126322 [Nemania abortiva]
MQSFNEYEPLAGPDRGLIETPNSTFDHSFYDLSYFPSYSPMGTLENFWELGDVGFEQQQQQHSQHSRPESRTEGLEQETMINLGTCGEYPPDTRLNTAWNKPRDQGQLTTLTTPFNTSGNPGRIASTWLPSPVSSSSPPRSPTTMVDPQAQQAMLQNKRHKNRVAAAKCRKSAKQSTEKLQQLALNLRQTNEMLRVEESGLREEVYNLKTAILCHSHCDSESIQRYIQRAAEKVGQEEIR